MAVIEEFLIGVGYKTDTKALEKARVRARKAAEDAEKAYKDASVAVEKAQEAVADATDKASKQQAQSALRAARQTAKAAKEAMKAATDASKEAQRAAKDAADEGGRRARKFREKWVKAAKVVGASLVGIGTAGLAGIAALGHQTIESSREFDLWSKRIGVTVEELQALDIVAKDSSVEVDNVREAVKTMRENLGELARLGTGPARDALGTLGIKLEEIVDLPAEEQLKLVATAMGEVGDDGQALSLIIELMGEDGAKLLPILKKGAGGIQELGDAARASGRIMSDDMVTATLEVDKRLKSMRGRVEAAGVSLGQTLLPIVADTVDATADWIEENDDFIKQDLASVLTAIAEAAKLVGSAFTSAVSAVADLGRAAGELGDKLSGKVIEVQLAWAVATGEISLEAANSVRAGLDKASVGRGAPALPAAKEEAIPDFVGSVAGPSFDPTAVATRAQRRTAFQKTELAKARGAGGGQTDAEKALAEALTQVRLEGLEDDLRALGTRAGASDKAIEASLKSAAEQFAKGASRKVARGAGVSTLSSLTGRDLKAEASDPLLSAIFGGIPGQPEVPLSELEKGQQPQVLISTINNTYNVEVNNQIDGSRDPIRVADDVEQRFRGVLQEELSRVSKHSKVVFAR